MLIAWRPWNSHQMRHRHTSRALVLEASLARGPCNVLLLLEGTAEAGVLQAKRVREVRGHCPSDAIRDRLDAAGHVKEGPTVTVAAG